MSSVALLAVSQLCTARSNFAGTAEAVAVPVSRLDGRVKLAVCEVRSSGARSGLRTIRK
jgi:hypothetical protein